MGSYFLIKHLHVTTVGLSLALFLLRSWWSVRGSSWLQQRWVRVLPHLIDTLLLATGITLMILLEAWPTRQPWLAAKLIGLLAYIGVGTIAIKRGRTATARAIAALIAVAIFAYIVGAAVAHHPLSWAWFVT
ncbi:Uncharacterized membrane protein SirB2 [Modicisalibacter ilicicola DSM 19980]|uniref:Uncharacterized membrane protein SirB2 n=1 Tax=Modicisalibacter ilicicola DSM 19980 TaxID=1121942 RepID=A0A1M4WBS4_9GAMM|nr:SirB2 family protein [Halomonas ilicicola]SHE78718.1 Uncharacterized membrane protein SirB2 [Halomonas ilicicola DSM 19980]